MATISEIVGQDEVLCGILPPPAFYKWKSRGQSLLLKTPADRRRRRVSTVYYFEIIWSGHRWNFAPITDQRPPRCPDSLNSRVMMRQCPCPAAETLRFTFPALGSESTWIWSGMKPSPSWPSLMAPWWGGVTSTTTGKMKTLGVGAHTSTIPHTQPVYTWAIQWITHCKKIIYKFCNRFTLKSHLYSITGDLHLPCGNEILFHPITRDYGWMKPIIPRDRVEQ